MKYKSLKSEKRKHKTNLTKGAFGKCRISKYMRDMRVYPKSKVKEILEKMGATIDE